MGFESTATATQRLLLAEGISSKVGLCASFAGEPSDSEEITLDIELDDRDNVEKLCRRLRGRVCRILD